MRYYKSIKNGYLLTIGTGAGYEEITKEEYESILSVIRSCPTAESGFEYRLKADLTWELYELPPVEDEQISADEFYSMLEEVL